MSFRKDSFSDEELTLMAEEITREFQSNTSLDETDSNTNPYLFPTDDSMDDEKIDKLPSISYFSSPNTDDNTVIINHCLSLSPKIVSESKLSSNDSFNITVPSIPSATPSPRLKQAINGWCQVNKNGRNKNRKYHPPTSKHNLLPYIPPPSIYTPNKPFINDIDSCIAPPDISPRKTIKKQIVSQIPNFCANSESKFQDEKVIINKDIITNKERHKHKRKSRHKCHKHKHKRKSKCNRTVQNLQCMVSPIIIDLEKHNYSQTKHKGIIIQPLFFQNHAMMNINKKRNKNDTACSVGVNMNKYMVENGFMFVDYDQV